MGWLANVSPEELAELAVHVLTRLMSDVREFRQARDEHAAKPTDESARRLAEAYRAVIADLEKYENIVDERRRR